MQVYADNAATTAMSRTAIDAMLPYLDNIYGNPSSLHSVGQRAKEALDAARETVAQCLGCEPREIIFTSGGSEADNQAITSAAYLGARKGKKHIISTTFEHHAVLHTLKRLEKQGFEVTLLDVHADGLVSAQQVADAIRDDTCLVTIMFANNEIGTIQPIEAIGAVCHERGVLFHTDAVQAAGHVKIDVNAMHIDLLSLSAHKFHGPKGVGMLYARRGIILTNLIEGGAQERGKRGGTENVPGIIGLGEAVRTYPQGAAEKMMALKTRLLTDLQEAIPAAKRNGPELDDPLCAPHILSVSLSPVRSQTMLFALEGDGIYVSAGSACAAHKQKVSGVLTAMGLSPAEADCTLRFSLCPDNTEAEMDAVAQRVKKHYDLLKAYVRR